MSSSHQRAPDSAGIVIVGGGVAGASVAHMAARELHLGAVPVRALRIS